MWMSHVDTATADSVRVWRNQGAFATQTRPRLGYGLWDILHTNGSHPELSDAEDAHPEITEAAENLRARLRGATAAHGSHPGRLGQALRDISIALDRPGFGGDR